MGGVRTKMVAPRAPGDCLVKWKLVALKVRLLTRIFYHGFTVLSHIIIELALFMDIKYIKRKKELYVIIGYGMRRQ
jgi:hypothetical protein